MPMERPKFRVKSDGSWQQISGPAPRVNVSDLAAYGGQTGYAPAQNSIFDGGKFPGGFGETQLFSLDYWTLRERSVQLYTENLYARGLIRRLVTNEINTGLAPEAAPAGEVLGIDEDELNDWSEHTETRFGLYAQSPLMCDWYKARSFGALQRLARTEAYVSGDVLVVQRYNRRTGTPATQLVSGSRVRTPLLDDPRIRKGHTVSHGVELDAQGRHVAYWITGDEFGEFRRLPAYGERSGRRLAWLVYGTDQRLGDVRGTPLLSLVLQSLKEIDRYRDSTQRKAVINSMLALFIKKTQDKMGTLPVSRSAVRRDSVDVEDSDGTTRGFKMDSLIPGVVLQELQTGEEPVGFHNQGVDEKFGAFEEAIIRAIAWANEVPPEILMLSFSNNYSASQAAINEFKIYINRVWSEWGESFCAPIYQEWLTAEVLAQKIEAPGLLDALRDAGQYDTRAAWFQTDWYGSIKPSTDMLKSAKGSQLLVANAWSTNAREARVSTGTKFSRNAARLKRENQLIADMHRPRAEFAKEFGEKAAAAAFGPAVSAVTADELAEAVTNE